MEEKNGTYTVRSQMFECVLLNFFHNFNIRPHTKTNEFHILETSEIENVGQGHEGEKRNLRRSNAMSECAFCC